MVNNHNGGVHLIDGKKLEEVIDWVYKHYHYYDHVHYPDEVFKQAVKNVLGSMVNEKVWGAYMNAARKEYYQREQEDRVTNKEFNEGRLPGYLAAAMERNDHLLDEEAYPGEQEDLSNYVDLEPQPNGDSEKGDKGRDSWLDGSHRMFR